MSCFRGCLQVYADGQQAPFSIALLTYAFSMFRYVTRKIHFLSRSSSIADSLLFTVDFYMSYIPPDDEDLIFFRKAMQDVKRLKNERILEKSVKKNAPLNQPFKLMQVKEIEHKFVPFNPLLLYDPIEQIIGAEDKLFFHRPGPQGKVIKRLMQGEIPRSACLDLHGMSVEQARLAVVQFLQVSRSAGFRCVQIIHGKGQLTPKLKNHINYWLPQIPWILAFSSAQLRDGGTGGVYILLGRSPSISNK